MPREREVITEQYILLHAGDVRQAGDEWRTKGDRILPKPHRSYFGEDLQGGVISPGLWKPVSLIGHVITACDANFFDYRRPQ